MSEPQLIDDPEAISITERRNVDESIGRPPSSILTFGPTVIGLLLVLLFVLSWIIAYPDSITAQAIITTPVPPQKEVARTTGRIDTIFVTDNQPVRPGMPLAIIENSANFNDVLALKALVANAERAPELADFPFDKTTLFILGDIEEAFSRFESACILYRLNEDLQPFSNESTANELNLDELNNRLESLNAQYELSQRELKLKEQDMERYTQLFEQRVISPEEYENKQLSYLQAKKNVKTISLSISQLKESKNNNAKTKKSIEINQTREKIQLHTGLMQAFQQLKKALKDWQLTYVLQSNIEGTVSFLTIWDENQRVAEGDLMFTIIPLSGRTLIAKLKTPALNSGKIKIGQPVNLKLENYPSSEFGVLRAKVTSISLVPDQEGFYLINASLPAELITSYNQKIVFKQEMRATAEIITDDLRLLERFFYQFKARFVNE